MSNVHARRRKMNDYRTREANKQFIFLLRVHLFLRDKKMETVDSQILDAGSPQRFIDSPIPERWKLDGRAATLTTQNRPSTKENAVSFAAPTVKD
jgi:hypothetical protein